VIAELSRQLLFGAITTYVVAMMLYAAEFVIGVSGPGAGVARPAGRRQPELVGAAVTAGGSVGVGGSPERVEGSDGVEGPDGAGGAVIAAANGGAPPAARGSAVGAGRDPGATDRAARWIPLFGRAAVAVTGLGLALHASGLVTRGIAAGRVPWGNMYEFIIAVTLVASIGWMGVVLRRPSVRPLGLFVTLVLVVLLGLDLIVLRTAVEPLVPALNSYWLKIHVTLAITASGTFMIGFCAALLHLVRTGYDRRVTERRPTGFPFSLGPRLPAAENLERLTFRIHAFAFPIWTLAIMCGAIWAEAAWGRYWGWDPKETWSFIAWVVYAGYLHARATPSVRRAVASAIAVAGWAMMMVNLFLVNIVVSGLHSYAGLK
jgi:cytochrome c-type biogenesis protein CcsB